MEYLSSNNLIHEAHHGSQKGKSIITAITTIVDSWSSLMEENIEVAALAMDQSAAYDLIDHPILLKNGGIGFSTSNYSLVH